MAAQRAATGYGTTEILEQVLESSRAVVDGRALHERDSVTFDRIEYSWPVLAGLLWSAALNGGSLRVLDFGGSLGTSYRQNRRFIGRFHGVSWAVVEQPGFVAAGRQHFANEVLSFHETLESAAATSPNVALLGSSLQYLERPVATLEAFARTAVTTLILDRTPLHRGPDHLLTLQHVPPSIYPAVYPAWILSRPRIEASLAKQWDLVEEFSGPEGESTTTGGTVFEWVGMILRRRT